MSNVVVLGVGMVGSAIAADLGRKHVVAGVDVSRQNLSELEMKHGIHGKHADVTNATALSAFIRNADLVVSAVPGAIGFETLRRIIENRKNVVDIAFFPEDAFELDELAKEMAVTAVVDCGVAPGMSNLLLGFHNSQMKVEKFECLVGGLPRVRTYPYEYKAPFSPSDVIEEYVRPARFVENGKIVIKEALSDPEFVDFPEIGTLESFNTDGLRSLIKTVDVPNMKEKTLRYPGHINLMRALRETGFFSSDVIDVKGQKVAPLDLSSQLLFKLWQLEPDDEEFTVMRISINGSENGKSRTYIYDLLDYYDVETRISSMARTTGYTCSAAVNFLLEGRFERVGVNPPEFLGENPDCVEYILNYLKERNVIYKKTVRDE